MSVPPGNWYYILVAQVVFLPIATLVGFILVLKRLKSGEKKIKRLEDRFLTYIKKVDFYIKEVSKITR